MLGITTYMRLYRKNAYFKLGHKERLVAQFCQRYTVYRSRSKSKFTKTSNKATESNSAMT